MSRSNIANNNNNNNNIYSSIEQGSFEDLQKCLVAHDINPSHIIARSVNESELYKRVNYQWNEYGGHKTPRAYIVVEKVSDIQGAVKCGRLHKFNVVPKSGGHSFEKYSYGDSNSVIIDLQLLDNVSIDPVAATAEVGPGNLLGPLAWKLYENGSEFAIPSGLCPSVGISLALGGGFGNLPRYFGLTSDSLLELDLIDTNGEIHVINESSNPDLFWALRGGGGSASFGIVSRFKLKLRKAPAHIIFSRRMYKLTEFPTLFNNWQHLISSGLPSTINSMLAVNNTHVAIDVTQVQPNPENIYTELIDSILALFNSIQPVTSNKTRFTYPNYILHSVFPNPEFYELKSPSDLIKIHRESFPIGFVKTKSFFISQTIDNSKDLTKLTSLLMNMPEGGNFELEAFGPGSLINTKSPTETAFVHRSALYHATVGYGGPNYESEGAQWLNKFYKQTQILMNHTESYQNYADKDLKDQLIRFYGVNLKRLIEIKKKVDPENYFDSPESIPIKL